MKSNLEKPKKVSKKTTLEVSPKVIIDEMNKENPRQGRKRVSYGYTYTAPLQKLVSEKEYAKDKPKTSRKKVVEEATPELPQLDMQPLDEREDWDHTKKGNMNRKQWKTPENIPVEQPSIDDMTFEELIAQPDDEGAFLIKEFGTKDPEAIDRITAERLKSGDYEQVIIGNTKGINGKEFKSAPKIHPKYGTYISPEKYSRVKNRQIDREINASEVTFSDLDDSTITSSAKQVHPQRDEKIHGSPSYSEIRDGRREKNSGHDNLKTISDSKQERASRGILNKIKNLWLELKADTKSIAEELGWDEEKELEKQAHEYKNHLKETPTRPDQDYYDLDKAA